MSPVERVRLNESGWTSPVERVRLNESGLVMSSSLVTPTTDPVHEPHCLRIAAFGGPTDCGSHRPRIAQITDHRPRSLLLIPSVDDHADSGSQCSVHQLTVVYTVRGSHRQRIIVDNHFRWSFRRRSLPLILPLMITLTADRSVRRTHWL